LSQKRITFILNSTDKWGRWKCRTGKCGTGVENAAP